MSPRYGDELMDKSLQQHLNDVKAESTTPYDFSARAEALAAERGKVCVYPKANELQLDIDSYEDLAVLQAQLPILAQVVTIISNVVTPSTREGHFHVTVTLEGVVSPGDRILYQALIGSDRKRELLSLIALRRGSPNPTVLFEKAPSNG